MFRGPVAFTTSVKKGLKNRVFSTTLEQKRSYSQYITYSLLYSAGFVIPLGGAIAFSPFFANTREGVQVAWHWNELTPTDVTALAESWAWQLWFGLSGLYAGAKSTGYALKKASVSNGQILLPFKLTPFATQVSSYLGLFKKSACSPSIIN